MWDNQLRVFTELCCRVGGLTLNMQRVLLTLLLMFPAVSLAGSWCLVSDENEFCAYESAEACYKVSSVRGGSCRENYKVMGSRGGQTWCLVTAQSRMCRYGAKTSCLRAARQVNGGCVENIERALLRKQTAGRKGGLIKCEAGDVTCEITAQLVEQRLEPEVVQQDVTEAASLDNY